MFFFETKANEYSTAIKVDSFQISPIDSNSINLKRLSIAGGITVFSYSYVYYYMKTQAWWKENPVDFHFDGGRDKVYALGQDKMGHFFVGHFLSERMATLLNWSGIEKNNAYICGAIWSSLTQFVVEVKDGYAPTYGFSWRDASWGTLGAMLPILKTKSKFFANSNFKFSYFPRDFGPIIDPIKRKRNATWHDDYINQTYWFSFNLKNNFSVLETTKIPNYLNLAVGLSLDKETDGFGKGNREILVSLDVDLKRLFKPKRIFWKSVVNTFEYIKFPAPAIKFGKNVPFKTYPLYF